MNRTSVFAFAAICVFSTIGAAVQFAWAFPYCWGSRDTIAAFDSDAKAGPQAALDVDDTLFVFWQEAHGGIYCVKNTDAGWTQGELVASAGVAASFGVTADPSDGLHLVWPDTTGVGSPGQTQSLMYRRKTGP